MQKQRKGSQGTNSAAISQGALVSPEGISDLFYGN